jgi:N-acetylmuramoyl-L-alanine amidase
MNNRKNFQHCLFYDCGHGGVSPKGRYTTAPSKMFEHVSGEYHKGNMFYEGVKNRIYGWEIIRQVRDMGINVIEVNHHWQDTDLASRVNIANMYNANIQKGFYVSEHSNATSKHNARGMSVWTSRGQTSSDILADMFSKMLSDASNSKVGRIRQLQDLKDGDSDYEANFYVLANTNMPAVLIENLFFDNKADADLLMDKNYFEFYTQLQANWIRECIEWLDENK